MEEKDIIKEGWMRKKTGRVNLWGERYFVLRGSTIYYYLKATDTVSYTFLIFMLFIFIFII